MSKTSVVICSACGKHHTLEDREWLCACGGLLDFKNGSPVDPDRIDPTLPGLWRYHAFLPLRPEWDPIALGEGCTPLIPMDWGGDTVHFKLEHISPSGSFKDRGSAVLVTALRGMGVARVVEDSSGNAGASLAAYTAHAGIACEVCVPDHTSDPKQRQIAAHGADVIEIKGKREYAALAAWAAAAHGAYYASHVFNPYFLAGIETMALEIWEQLEHNAPRSVVVPVGNGTLLLGLYRGFRRLKRAGLIEGLPRMYAVQAEACAPIVRAYEAGESKAAAVIPEPSNAGSISVGKPARGKQILAAIRVTNGGAVTISEEEIVDTRSRLARQGFYVEATAATAVAAIGPLRTKGQLDGTLVVPLTGHGLKEGATA